MGDVSGLQLWMCFCDSFRSCFVVFGAYLSPLVVDLLSKVLLFAVDLCSPSVLFHRSCIWKVVCNLGFEEEARPPPSKVF